MKRDSKTNTLSFLIPILLAVFLAKAFWVGVLFYLPKSSIEREQKADVEPLYYRYALASKKDVPKPIITRKKKIKKPPKVVKKPKNQEIKKFILKGIYYSKSQKIATVEYLGKTYVLEVGEEIKGFKLTKVKPEYVIFSKDDMQYKIEIFKDNSKTPPPAMATTPPKVTLPTQKKEEKKENKDIIQEGDTTIISKSVFNKYKGDINGLRKYIGGVPIIKNGRLRGFKISYIKKGSDFDKVGLKRGDIITAINGEEITDLSVPMRFINNLDSITAATITVKRGNEVKELEYEVR